MLHIEPDSKAIRVRFRRMFIKLTSLPTWAAYLVAACVVLGSTWFLVLLQEFVAEYDRMRRGPAFVAIYFVAISVATVIGGLNAGLFSVLLSIICTYFFLLPSSQNALQSTMSNNVTLVVVLSVGSILALGMEGLRSNTRLLISNLDLLQAAQARADREAVLNKIGQAVRTANDPEQVQALSVESLGQMLNADGCYFLRLNSTKDSALVGHYWRHDGLPPGGTIFHVSKLWAAVEMLSRTGKSIVFNDCRTDPVMSRLSQYLEEQAKVRAGIVVPLFTDDQLDSALAVFMFDSGRVWDPSEVHLVEIVAAHSRGAVDAMRIQQKEHNIAVQLQAALQPELSLKVPGMEIASFYRAALDEANVGGDFYDGFAVGGGKYALVIGDVSGKGLAAASQVAAIRNMMRCLLQTTATVAESVELLNEVLIQQELLPSFATMFVMVFDPVSLIVEYVSCGHEPALLYRQQYIGSVEYLETTGPVIGVFESPRDLPSPIFTSRELALKPGDAILMYTDGVCDAGPNASHLLGTEGISKQLKQFFVNRGFGVFLRGGTAAKQLLQYCVDETEKYADGDLRDDICLLAVVVESLRPNTSSAVRTEQEERDHRRRLAEDLKLATSGKLRIVESVDQFPAPLPSYILPIDLAVGENVRVLRKIVREASERAEFDCETIDALELAVGEAANNTLVHAARGRAQVFWDDHGAVQIKVWDYGPGIPFDDLPRAVLERGYTTSHTLGQGFSIIMDCIERCWITTSENGTILLLEQTKQSNMDMR